VYARYWCKLVLGLWTANLAGPKTNNNLPIRATLVQGRDWPWENAPWPDRSKHSTTNTPHLGWSQMARKTRNPDAIKYFVDLHAKVQNSVLQFFKNTYGQTCDLNKPLPKRLRGGDVMTFLVEQFFFDIRSGKIPINADNLNLPPMRLSAIATGTPQSGPNKLSYLIQYIYEQARRAGPRRRESRGRKVKHARRK
jgi:hypothetical protein